MENGIQKNEIVLSLIYGDQQINYTIAEKRESYCHSVFYGTLATLPSSPRLSLWR